MTFNFAMQVTTSLLIYLLSFHYVKLFLGDGGFDLCVGSNINRIPKDSFGIEHVHFHFIVKVQPVQCHFTIRGFCCHSMLY